MFRFVVLSALIVVALAGLKVFNPRLDGRVVGGRDVEIEDYPHQVSLLWHGSHVCGGSIIGTKHIVTAAHCTVGDTPDVLSIRAGSSIRNQNGIIVQVSKINQHPQYNSVLYDYDITVLELTEELTFGPGISSIDLPVENQAIESGSASETSGWGRIQEGGPYANQLQAVSVRMVSNEACNEAYGRGSITERMVCAGVPEGGKDACQGDSGGPLTVGGQLIGIVSWGQGCARPEYPGVYASVPNLRGYITETSGI